MTTTKTYFTVEGRGEFPLDMLRYDECWPSDSEDAQKMQPQFGNSPLETLKKRRVRLGCVKRGGPTPARWESFN